MQKTGGAVNISTGGCNKILVKPVGTLSMCTHHNFSKSNISRLRLVVEYMYGMPVRPRAAVPGLLRAPLRPSVGDPAPAPAQTAQTPSSTPTRAHARPCPRRRPSRCTEGSLTSCRAEQPVRAPLQHAAAISAVVAAAAVVRTVARIAEDGTILHRRDDGYELTFALWVRSARLVVAQHCATFHQAGHWRLLAARC